MNDAAITSVKRTRIVFGDSMITTWADASPHPDLLASGTDLGFHRFSHFDGPIQDAIPEKVVPSSEAINGLAFVTLDEHLFFTAASTRAELAIHRHDRDDRHMGYTLECGAHGVHATAWGGFLAPMGRMGVVSIVPDTRGRFKQSRLFGKNGVPYCYKLASLGLIEDREVWVGAGRNDGLFSFILRNNGEIEWSYARQSIKQPLDFVGVCSIGNTEYPRAAVGLGRDGTLLLTIDMIADQIPLLQSFPEMRGTAYKIQSSMGHVFIHTSEQLYVFIDMASRFLQGESLSGQNRFLTIPIDCFDFNIAFDRWLILLDELGINILAIGDILGGTSQSKDSSMNATETHFDGKSNESIILDHSENSLLYESDLQLV